jgi:filamentous hemagglutinin family protein
VAAVVIVLGGGRAALALPEGMVVQGGQLVLQQQDANNAVLHQGTPRAAADFNSFNIDAGQRLQILQPDAASTLLGRITNGQLTEIHGRLDANGRVLLINPAGVLVGPGGVINTAAFTATTLHVDHQRFMQGGPVELKTLGGSNPAASVINRGTIQVADGGFAALVAPRVLNAGVITARLGQIQLASGTAATLDISGDGLLSVTLDPALAGSITNAGTLRGSYVRLGGGDAAILAAATVQQSGLIEARNLNELTGGRITIEGQHITVTSGAVLDASGANGGGQILVGGSWQNSDPSVRQATTTHIEAGAVLDASAILSGHGGTVVAWSDIHNPAGATTVAGTLAMCTLRGLEVFATGGIGGVHRDAPFDESADLVALSHTPVIVVCAGAKSILDLPATLERLETLGVPVVGYRTSELPGFFSMNTGLALTVSLDTPDQIAAAWLAHLAVGCRSAMLVVQPPPVASALSAQVVNDATVAALTAARVAGVRGAAVTPFLLADIQRRTEGKSVVANLALLENNAALAGRIAVALAAARVDAAPV